MECEIQQIGYPELSECLGQVESETQHLGYPRFYKHFRVSDLCPLDTLTNDLPWTAQRNPSVTLG